MSKSPDAFRTISEVADWLDKPAHVLRFWESKFPQVKPVKRAGGRRYYRPDDMLLLGGIKKLLHDDGLTIKGAQKIIREQGVRYVASLSQPLDDVTLAIHEPVEHDIETPVALDVQPEAETATVLPFHPMPRADEEPTAASDAAVTTVEAPPSVPATSHEAEPQAPAPLTPEPAASDSVEATGPDVAADRSDAGVADATHGDGPATAPVQAEPAAPAATPASPPGSRSDEAAALPSFLRSASRPEPVTAPAPATEADEDPVDAAPPATPQPDPPRPRPRVIDVPDVPPPGEIDAAPGLITRLLAYQRPVPDDVRATLATARARLVAHRATLAQRGRE